MIRPPAVAGTFYPGEADALAREVDRLLVAAPVERGAAPPKALVAPHAGYRYSGPTAACAYAALGPARAVVRRVVLLGPPHRAPVRGVAASGAEAFATPLGAVRVDDMARRIVLGHPAAHLDDRAHAAEHCLEVQLPFLQRTLPDATIVPLLVHAPRGAVAELLDLVWGGSETLIVISTDLSHYLPYEEAARLDRATAAAILSRRPEAVGDEDACGASALRGMLEAARRRRLDVRLLDLRSSGDTGGGRDAVVGYGAFALA